MDMFAIQQIIFALKVIFSNWNEIIIANLDLIMYLPDGLIWKCAK